VQQACVHRLFEAQAAARPQSVALIADNLVLTYEALNARANRLARFLRKSGVGPETIVGVLMARSADLIIALMAILKSGGAYLPLDSGLPSDRIAYMVEDSNASLILTTQGYASKLRTGSTQTVVLEEHADAIAGENAEDLTAAARPDGLAYVIYTSGSTGKPKGVMIEHGSMINFIKAAMSEYCIGPADRILQFAAINFDTSVEEIYPCLCGGGTLVLRDDAMLTSMAAFAEAVQRFGITVLDLPTVFWHELALSLDKGEISIPQCVRQVIIGGEKANIEALKRWRRHVDNSVRLLNTYGPTETTVVATVCDLSRQTHELDSELGVSIGRPLANVRCYVLDRYRQPVPIGIPGELHIGGSALARGYLNKPDLTQTAFIPDPFRGEPGRLYKTGDMVRLMGDGHLVFVGRSDNQIKIRGYRIEIGEIETCLEEHPQIDHAVVTDFADKNGQKRLVAYIVPKHRRTPAFDEIREYLKKNLPDYMVPSIFEVLETLPLTANGKIDLKSLPVPGTGALGAERKITTPRNDTEAALIAIWKTILDVQEIDVFDNFFDIGGHSLLIARLTPRIKERLRVDISFRQFFETPTVAELAKVAEAMIYLSEGHSSAPKRVDPSREEIAI